MKNPAYQKPYKKTYMEQQEMIHKALENQMPIQIIFNSWDLLRPEK